MIKLQYGFFETEVPGSWHELSPKQMEQAIAILCKKKDAETAQLEFIYSILPKTYRKLMESFSDVELLELRKQFAFLLEKPSFDTFVIQKIRKPWSLIRLHGPANSFSNLTVREYGTAEFYLKQFTELDATPGMNERANENLNRFVACIFWSAKHGERAVPFSSTKFYAQLKEKAIWIDKLPMAKKLAIAHNFSAVREFVFSQFDEAFARSGAESKRDKYGWDGVVNHIAATRHMVPDSIYNMNLLQLLVQLDTMAIIENERQEQ